MMRAAAGVQGLQVNGVGCVFTADDHTSAELPDQLDVSTRLKSLRCSSSGGEDKQAGRQGRDGDHRPAAAAFFGNIGMPELNPYPDAIEAIRIEGIESGWNETEIDDFVGSLKSDQSPSAYLFQCLTCHKFLAYSDFV